jgi:hypothetical protein
MKTRTDLLNHLAEKYNLQRYLEIGVQVPELNFDKIKCRSKLSVDPDPNARAIYRGTSDEFFSSWFSAIKRGPVIYFTDEQRKQAHKDKGHEFDEQFDLIFIDGLHTAEQVKKDFENALKILSPNGFIVLHDCNPEKEEHTIVPRPTERGHWNGDVWKFAVAFTGYDRLWRWTVDIDNGCTVFWNRSEALNETVHYGISEMSWSHFDKNRKEFLNLISWDEFISLSS